MKFLSERKLRLVRVNQFVSKNGNNCTFLVLADPVTFESIQFMPIKDFDLSSVSTGKDYTAIIYCDGRYTNVELV